MKLKKDTYRKTMNTVAKVGGYAGKAALASAIYTNPAIAGTVLAAYATKAALQQAQKPGDRYFKNKKGKGARLYRSGRDIANASLNYMSGDYAGSAINTAKLIGDTGLLSNKMQKKYNDANSNYITPTLQVARAGNTLRKIKGI